MLSKHYAKYGIPRKSLMYFLRLPELWFRWPLRKRLRPQRCGHSLYIGLRIEICSSHPPFLHPLSPLPPSHPPQSLPPHLRLLDPVEDLSLKQLLVQITT